MRHYTQTVSDIEIADFAKAHKLYHVQNLEIFISTVKQLHLVASISDRILPLKSYLDLVRHLQQQEKKSVCVDDEFLAACVFLNLEISIFSAVYCLKGISSDFKETKMNRDVENITDPITAADLRHKLSKPNEIRGAVECNTILTSYNRLIRRMRLHERTNQIIKQLDQGISKQEIMRNFSLTLTDFELVMRIARRENLLSSTPRKPDASNHFKLNASNLQSLQMYAQNHDVPSTQQALNDVLEQFFITQKVRQQNKSDVAIDV